MADEIKKNGSPRIHIEEDYVKIHDWALERNLDDQTVAFIIKKVSVLVGRIGSVKMASAVELEKALNRLVITQGEKRDKRKENLKKKAELRKQDQELGAVARSRKLTKEIIAGAAQNGTIQVDKVPVVTKNNTPPEDSSEAASGGGNS
jgi:hypothetical protein